VLPLFNPLNSVAPKHLIVASARMKYKMLIEITLLMLWKFLPNPDFRLLLLMPSGTSKFALVAGAFFLPDRNV
jgi:hypothetical protein